ncbi:MAG: hypothetical protein IJU37_01225 [Desulfovibrio sp.]|nr:hypothetical protein [Desulfovibrio sp.]
MTNGEDEYRMLLTVDARSGQCRFVPLSADFEGLGGRLLAVALAGQELGAQTTQDPCLVLAPGLLAGFPTATRCALACRLPEKKGISSASAGGAAAMTLAHYGLRALLIRGLAQDSLVRDLVLDASGATLVPAPQGEDDGDQYSWSMAHLAALWPQAQCIITAGPLGRLGVPLASLTCSDVALRPSSHVGGGSGLALGLAGIRAIVIDTRNIAPGQNASRPKELPQMNALMEAISAQAQGAPCALNCAACGLQAKRPGKWPGFSQVWASGDVLADAAALSRYAAVCDALQVDAFGLATRLEELAHRGIVPFGQAEIVLQALDVLAQRPETSWLLPWLRGWYPAQRKATARTIYMDTLGLCRFAAGLVDNNANVRQAFCDLPAVKSGKNVFDAWLAKCLELESA